MRQSGLPGIGTSSPQIRRPSTAPAGRPPVTAEIRQLIVRMATENRDWGYTRIQGALANVPVKIHTNTVAISQERKTGALESIDCALARGDVRPAGLLSP